MLLIAFNMYLLSFPEMTEGNGCLPQMGYRIKLGEPKWVYWAYFQGAQGMDYRTWMIPKKDQAWVLTS